MKEIFNIIVLIACIGTLGVIFSIPAKNYSFDGIIKDTSTEVKKESSDIETSKNTEKEESSSNNSSLVKLLTHNYNGEYKNETNNGKYFLLAENTEDGTFSIIFVDTGEFQGVSEVLYPVNIDGATLTDDNEIVFEDSDLASQPLKLVISENGAIVIPEGFTFDHPEFEGSFVRVRTIPSADVTFFKAM